MRVVFIGDSITETGRFDEADAPLGRGYVRLLADHLGPETTVINRGIGGNRIADLQQRWSADAMTHAPTLLSVYIGINDTWRRAEPGEHTSPDEFARAYRDLLDRALASGHPRLVLMEPFLLPLTAAQEAFTDDVDLKRAVVASIASEYGATHVALQAPLSAAASGQGPAAIAYDGVHPTPYGHSLIASLWRDAVS
ncbi:SGNH/GDSL hydrolase family protein [Salinibacterium sp. G-O1]|uniref:SGNH/GDSL hydrolase family protein n=1 Tax=Salinibacterium sp. G-O1 TaxID=3046208 RepID=UPI0024B9FB6E|nr:SGNH/GDSL hydrolase family protein [Salinibacterium sp. G-O1]MDJ0333882.1 SGNH/GDSL hydrolase family protein [Salinibacterium sp. G-O1]